MPEVIVDDFPLRGRTVKLRIKRRRWREVKSGNIVQRDWYLNAKGTRMTTEFAEFLKKSADTKALPCKVIAKMYGVNEKKFQRQYTASVILKFGNKILMPRIGFYIPKTSANNCL